MSAQHLRQVLLMPWRERRNRGALRSLAWTAALSLLPFVALAVSVPRNFSFALLAAVLLIWLAGLWCMGVDGLLLQNTPTLARMLPGQVRALRLALGLQALVVAVAVALLWRATLPLPLTWLWLLPPLLVLLTWMIWQPFLWLPVCLSSVWGPQWWQLSQAWVAASPALHGAGLLLSLGLLIASIGRGGRVHQWTFARRQRLASQLRAQAEGRATSVRGMPTWALALGRLFDWPLRLHWRHLVAHPSRANQLARLELGLLGGAHWTGLVGLMVMLLALAVGVLVVADPLPSGLPWTELIDRSRYGLCIAVFTLLCGPGASRVAALWASRREQALLVLLPGPPVGSTLGQALRARNLRQFLGLWLFGLALVMAVCAQGEEASWRYAAAHAACCLPVALCTRRDWARLTAPPGFPWLACLPAIAVLPAYAAMQLRLPALVSLGTAAALTLGLWLSGRAPAHSVLPVGRLQG